MQKFYLPTALDAPLVWSKILLALENKEIVKGTILDRKKGGFWAEVFGLAAFLPGSQIMYGRKPDKSKDYTRKMVNLRIISADKDTGNIVVSRRVIIEERMAKRKSIFFDSIREGDIKVGYVVNIMSYGLFVQIGPMASLLHDSAIPQEYLSSRKNFFQRGTWVRVVISKIDYEKKMFNLRFKEFPS